MINSVVIIPTGDEILEGIVTDTNSPAIMGIILEKFPSCKIARLSPCMDTEEEILSTIDKCVSDSIDLIILIGGSGGGHRYEATLGKDYTHSALVQYLSDASYKEIYGPNGHMWSKLVVGKKSNSIVVNVPGPYVEAVAASKVCISLLKEGVVNQDILVENISNAVFMQYPSNKK